MTNHFVNLTSRGVQYMLHVSVGDDGTHQAKMYRQVARDSNGYQPVCGSTFLSIEGKILFQDEAKVWPWDQSKLMKEVTNKLSGLLQNKNAS